MPEANGALGRLADEGEGLRQDVLQSRLLGSVTLLIVRNGLSNGLEARFEVSSPGGQISVRKPLELRFEGIDGLDLLAELLEQTTMGIAPHGFDESLKHTALSKGGL